MKENGFDLSSLDALKTAQEEGQDVDILHPVTGDPLGIVITVAGPDSERAKVARQRMVDARIKSQRARRLTSAEMDAENQRLLADLIIRWSGVVIDKNSLEFSRDAAVGLFKRFPFIREQLEGIAGDRAGFMKS